MKRIWIYIFILLFLSGCGRHYVMDRADMYLVPSVESMPDKITFVAEVLDPVKNLSEGGKGRNAWKAVLSDGKGNEEYYLAVDLGFRTPDCERYLVTMIPKSLDSVKDSYYFGLNRTGSTIYNNYGESRDLKRLSKKVDPTKHGGFLKPLGKADGLVREVEVGSADYNELLKIYKNFRAQELNLVIEYSHNKYGSNLTEEELEEIRKEDSVIRSFAEWMQKDWIVFLTYPLPSISGTALVSGVTKIFTLPSIWGDKINKPGYMEYITDAKATAEISLRAVSESIKYTQCMQNQ